MSEARDALERTQARLKELEAQPSTDDQLARLATELEREAQGFEQLLARGERRALAREITPQAARLMTFGFSLGFVGPIVAMVGVSGARFLRHQPELSVVTALAGAVLIIATLLAPTQRAVAHLFSPEWRSARRARRMAARLRSFLPLS